MIDLFAGGGGASAGLEAALGRPVDIAINHDPIALAVHNANHPETRHLEADIWEVKPRAAVGGRRVAILWASPDCTHFSVAKGDVPRRQDIRSLAWAVTRWAKEVRPEVIFLENVSEFRGWGPLGPDGRPDKSRMGATFRRWIGRLEGLGYQVDYRVLDASLYGAPTRRRRLFLIARRDGRPIRWPEVTHGRGLEPVHTAAECIDWSLPCPSIFERKRPLAEKTQWRIAQGIRRFVLENPSPFVIRYNSGERWDRSQALDQPLSTQDTSNRFGLVSPSLVEINHSNAPHGVDEPLGVVTTQHNRFNLVTPFLAQPGQRHGRGQEQLDLPLSTIVAKGRHALVAPALMKFRHDSEGAPVDAPLPTVTAGGQPRPGRPATGNPLGLLVPTLIQTGYGEREGQAPRALDLQQPLGTVVAGGQKHAVVAAWLAKHFGGVVGQEVERPIGAVTGRDHHSLAAATLVRFNHDDHGVPLDAPAPTITGGANHLAEVRAFLTAFYGTDGTAGKGQSLREPMRTLTAKHRLGLVAVEGHEFQIIDIGMRMLEPHELLRAQFGRFAEAYSLAAATTKAAKVRLIGNSVCPEIAEAIVRANLPGSAEERVA